jgi:hypothetical protein
MKTFERYTRLLFLLLIIGTSFFQFSYAQDEKKEKQDAKKAVIKNLIDSQDFDFVAQTVLPQRGVTRQLTSIYNIAISKDSVVSDLPYFGRAYSAPYNPSEVGLKFTSTKFELTKTPGKKSGWNILIKPKDYTEVQQLSFRIFENGSASLNIINLNRDAISFQGFIKERRGRK